MAMKSADDGCVKRVEWVELKTLHSRFAVGRREDDKNGGKISEYMCPLDFTPHYAFARATLRSLVRGDKETPSGTGYGRYVRFEFWAQNAPGNLVRESGTTPDYKGQWHTPIKFRKLIKDLLQNVSNGKLWSSEGKEGKYEIEVVKCSEKGLEDKFFLLDGVHRAAFLLALTGGDMAIPVTIMGKDNSDPEKRSWAKKKHAHRQTWPLVKQVVSGVKEFKDICPFASMKSSHNKKD